MFFKIRCIRLSFWRLKFLGFTRSTLSSHICSTDSIPWVHHSREEGSLDYDGRLVLLQVYLKFNMIIHHQQLACGREGDDGDVMAAQLVRPALRLLAGRAACMAASCCTSWRGDSFLRTRQLWCSSRVSGPTHQSGLDLSCEAKTSL
jgi:hypothetical protein